MKKRYPIAIAFVAVLLLLLLVWAVLLCQPRIREEAPVLTATEEGLETIIATGYNACEHVRPANGARGKAADRTLRCCGEVESMPKAAIVLNLLFFLPLLGKINGWASTADVVAIVTGVQD